MVGDALRRERHVAVRRNGQRADRAAAALEHDALRLCDLDLRCGGLSAAARRDFGDTGLVGRGEHTVGADAALVRAVGDALCVHGQVVGVNGGGGQRDLRAGQRPLRGGREIDVILRSARRVRRDQKDVVGDRAGAALGGDVHDAGGGFVRHGGDQRGGAAAVERHRRDAAELCKAHTDGGERRADAVAGLAAVDGVEDQGAVGALADGGARRTAGGKTGLHRAVFDEQLRRADEVDAVVPLAAGVGGDEHVDPVAALQREERRGIGRRRLVVRGQDVHTLRHLGVHRVGEHLDYAKRQRAADGQRAALGGAEHLDAALAGAGGVAGVEAVVVEKYAVVALTDVVERVEAEAVPFIDGGVDRELRITDHRAAVGAKAHRAVGIAADVAQHAAGHGGADGNAVLHAVVVAVDAGDDAHPLRLLFLRGAEHRGQGAGGLAVGDQRCHASAWGVDNVVFPPQVGVGIAPECAVRQPNGLRQRGVPRGEVVPQRVGRAHGDRRNEKRGG